LTLAAASVGTIQWQSSTDNATWDNLGNAIAPTTATNAANSITVTNLTESTWYRVMLTSGTCTPATTSAFQVVVNQPSVAGTISGTNGLCIPNTGTTLTLNASLGSIAWYKGTVSGSTITYATTAAGTASTLATGVLTATTAYKAVVKNGACSSASIADYVITVSPAVVSKAITGTSAVCLGTNTATLTLAAASVGTIQWQSSIDNTNWENVGNAIAPTTATNAANSKTVTNLTQSTWYRVMLTSGTCNQATTAAFQVVVNQPSVQGSISGTNVLCVTNTGTTLTLNGSTGSIAWYKGTVSGSTITYATTAAGTASTLATGALTATTAYKAVVKNGVCSSASTADYVVMVSPLAVAKTISGNTGATTLPTAVTICSTSTKLLTYLTTGSVGSIQWQYINVDANASTTAPLATDSRWANIPNATTANTYNAPSLAQTGNVWFRVKVSSSPCSDAFSPAVNVWLKACPSTVRTVETQAVAFGVVAYPNPSSENFNFTLTSSSEEKVNVVVYDMTGKLIDQREVTPTEVSELQIGDRYPSGVYNVIVTQGENTKTLRLIKR
jgi:hypothetical protein